MKNRSTILTLIIFLIFTNLCSAQIKKPEGYKSIIDTLGYETASLYESIIPDENYDYWKVVRKIHNLEEFTFFEKGDRKKIKKVKDVFSDRGFSVGCDSRDCFTYIKAYKDGQSTHFNDDAALRKFIGCIDNLSEAVLVALTFGFGVDGEEMMSNLYFTDENYIYMYLSKQSSCPDTRESFWVKINRKTQAFESNSNRLFYKFVDDGEAGYFTREKVVYKSDKCRKD